MSILYQSYLFYKLFIGISLKAKGASWKLGGKCRDFDTHYKDPFLGLQRRGTLWFINESINMLAYCGLMPLNYFLSFRNWSDFKEKTRL